ncbi:MAG: isoprenylcysteine carboxylmethyltransferase family protein [Armatimonadetes bacterium]|nr:isoprenylcysteine carboxylmethyltransferase family protein [Armatimonadota bacterium]MDE2207701.1 isoprenylcysteine carboxylmethyltransferase family protein [Armatimonadota bacterium]
MTFLRATYACWWAFLVIWLIASVRNKRTQSRMSIGSLLVYAVPLWVAAWLLLWNRLRHPVLAEMVIPRTVASGATGFVIVLLGLAVAVWARFTIGRNWSGTVTFKDDHKLVQNGPYAFVRHPIYTGLLLMFLGTAIAGGRLSGLVALPLAVLSCWIKLRQEEGLMVQHFGAQYTEYKTRVKALVPFVV